jgi:chromosome segregation ATPase
MAMTQATDDVYYLYVSNGWSGPFRLEQIKLFVRDQQISAETYAFEPQQQMQLTVGQLLAPQGEARTASFQNPSAPPRKPTTRRSVSRAAASSPSSQAMANSPTPVMDNSGKSAQVVAQPMRVAPAARATTPAPAVSAVNSAAARTGGAGAAKARAKDPDTFDLDAPNLPSGNGPRSSHRSRVIDEDTFDLEPGPQDDDSIDLDQHEAGTDRDEKAPLAVVIDAPLQKAGEQRLQQPYQPQPGSQEALELVLGELESLRKAYHSLMENSIKDREEAQQRIHRAHLSINEVLEERKADIAEVRSLIAEVDQVASELADRHHDQALSTRIVRLRDSLRTTDVSRMVEFAESVLRRIVEQAKPLHAPPVPGESEDPFAHFEDGHAAAPDPPSGNTIAKTARIELDGVKNQVATLKKAHDELQQTFALAQQDAREKLLQATALLEAERSAHDQDIAEVRSLAAEIYRLACELNADQVDAALGERIVRLWDQLGNADPVAIGPAAEEVLLKLVATLRERHRASGENTPAFGAGVVAEEKRGPGDATRRQAQIAELGAVRAELLEARSDLALMRQREAALQEEKARLQHLLEEQKLISEKAQQAAKAREQRLRSTVCALEVTKELHQEVMRDLQVQLSAAQSRVEEMEQELRTVRGGLDSAGGVRGHEDLQGEMRRLVEMRAMLDARRQELSTDLRNAEAELQRITAPGAPEDESLAEILAAKINHLRLLQEQTQKRLSDEEVRAQSMQRELETSRREAKELRGRSDSLSSELESARTNLNSARKRVEELHLAQQRLEAERESLQGELAQRKGTDTFGRTDGTPAVDLQGELAAATVRADTLEHDLARERRKSQELNESLVALQERLGEISRDRDRLRDEHERALADQAAEQAAQANAIASATQAAIEAEMRQGAALATIRDLEQQVAAAQASARASAGPLQDLPRIEQELAAARSQLGRTREELAVAIAARVAAERSAATAVAEANDKHAELARKLAAAEKDVETAAAQRDELQARASQSAQDRTRLGAEIERLRRELESASNEHRAALSSARNRLAEEQAQAVKRDQALAEARQALQTTASQRESLNAAYAQVVSARDRATAEVDRLTTELGRIQGERSDESSLNKEQRAALETARDRALAEAREAALRIEAAEARLGESARTAANAQARVVELESAQARALAERTQILAELDRLRGELVTANTQRERERLDVERNLGAQSAAARAQTAAATAHAEALAKERDELQAQIQAQMKAGAQEVERIGRDLARFKQEAATRERAAADALSRAEARHAGVGHRLATAEQLLSETRAQATQATIERDGAIMRLAVQEARVQELELQLEQIQAGGGSRRPKSEGDMVVLFEGEALTHEAAEKRAELERELEQLRATIAAESAQGADLAAEAERLRTDGDRHRAEVERLRKDLERQRGEAERNRSEAERFRADALKAQQEAARAQTEKAAQEMERKRLARELEAQRDEAQRLASGRPGRRDAQAAGVAEAELKTERARLQQLGERLGQMESALTTAADSQVVLEQERDRLAAEVAQLRAVPAVAKGDADESDEMAALRRRLKRARRKLRQARAGGRRNQDSSRSVRAADADAANGIAPITVMRTASDPTVMMRTPTAPNLVTTIVSMSPSRPGMTPPQPIVQTTPVHQPSLTPASSWPRTRALTPAPAGNASVSASWSQAPAAPVPASAAPAPAYAPPPSAPGQARNLFGDPAGFTPLAYDPTQVPPPPPGGVMTGPLGTRISNAAVSAGDKTFTSRLSRQPVMTVRHSTQGANVPTVMTTRMPAPNATTQTLQPMPAPPVPLWRHRWVMIAVAAVVLLGLAALELRSMVRALPSTRTAEVVIGLDQVRAPIAGVIDLTAPLRIGQALRENDALLNVTAVDVDTSTFDGLKQKLAETQVRQRKADQDANSISNDMIRLTQDSDQLESALVESERNVLARTEELQNAERDQGAKAATMDTLNALAKVVAIPGLDWVSASQESQEAQRKLDEREAALNAARATRDVQRQHLFEDRKHIADFNQQVTDLHALSTSLGADIADLTKAVATEQTRLDGLRKRTVMAPHVGQLHQLLVHNNDTVKVDQPLMDVTVPSELRISATIDTASGVQPNDRVIIQSGSRSIEGWIVAVNPASFDDVSTWSDLTPVVPGQERLEIMPDQPGFAAGLVGQSVSVVVVGENPGAMRQFIGILATKFNH